MQVITQFLKMETLLDDSVNQKIELQIERGGASLTVNLTVRVTHSWYLFDSKWEIEITRDYLSSYTILKHYCS